MNPKYPLYKYIAAILVTLTLSCQMFFVPANAGQEEDSSLNLNAQSAVLMDASTGRVLYGKEEDLIRPMASTTKIMTCILALERCDPDDEVVVSSYAASQP
ncbi:MAG: D-alanyl-D-alanine carboxypeptidase, partial [Hungatella sp.]|nr:D-alanyl-D-alanine carboxypeptidase [Hungatella sp.]